MAISKNSVRVQFTLNLDKPKENQIAEFLSGCMDQNNSIKEIIYNYIVSNSELKSLEVTQIEVTQSDTKLLTMSNSEHIDKNIVSNSEVKLHEVSELEINELAELSKFI
ncbi:hypothetical protein [Clostridium tagluense]|uniref:hypothetical protein n=1 Tax=Clostridium tagluense TaxID=360422 RepID=UPI001C6E7750|nr:hypothetical protein [Clostridium tagluense]MBW9157218.1 hypothetical protein [Clostridium tagluense]WLC67181.1 hypothetical protein KTC93_08385 [Clostridium tagluense]